DEAERHQRVHAADGDARDDELEREDHVFAHVGTSAPRSATSRRPCPYSSSIISAYLVRIVARRTFWVRVSSPSSASSSLSNRANPRMRADSHRPSLPRPPPWAHRADPPAFCERSLKVGRPSRFASAQFPTLPMSIWI